MELKALCIILLVVWADLRFAYWNLSKRLDDHLGEAWGGKERRKIHA